MERSGISEFSNDPKSSHIPHFNGLPEFSTDEQRMPRFPSHVSSNNSPSVASNPHKRPDRRYSSSKVSPRHYNGRTDVRAWLRAFERIAFLKSWSDYEAITVALIHFEAEADRWANSDPSLDSMESLSWSDFKAKLLKAFRSTETTAEDLFRQMKLFHQDHSESATEYALRFRDLCLSVQRYDMKFPESILIDTFVSGLLPHLYDRMGVIFASLDDAFLTAQKVERHIALSPQATEYPSHQSVLPHRSDQSDLPHQSHQAPRPNLGTNSLKISLSKFDGRSDICLWLKRFEWLSSLQSWSDFQAISIALLHFTDLAKRWALADPELDAIESMTWTGFKSKLISAFPPPTKPRDLWNELNSVRQLRSEPIREYFMRFRDLSLSVQRFMNIDDRLIADLFISGLAPQFLVHVSDTTFNDLTEAWTSAARLEERRNRPDPPRTHSPSHFSQQAPSVRSSYKNTSSPVVHRHYADHSSHPSHFTHICPAPTVHESYLSQQHSSVSTGRCQHDVADYPLSDLTDLSPVRSACLSSHGIDAFSEGSRPICETGSDTPSETLSGSFLSRPDPCDRHITIPRLEISSEPYPFDVFSDNPLAPVEHHCHSPCTLTVPSEVISHNPTCICANHSLPPSTPHCSNIQHCNIQHCPGDPPFHPHPRFPRPPCTLR
eukprot:TRINITY_DN2462_c0_g1::TRINITY_DN2462_c0_g1_i1::g.9008::m.9008 TRINITY_DN2462_c0_g1::TRINITY_DN2462_c0_g1_i1::g.9008  ORF type:complete len:663 (-),score=19.14,Retrotrans_gag/PF03732.12/4e-08,Retrotrans_gag/PF03732.12/1.9e-09,UBN2/PF14223.1/0.022,UBN2/PF14223.1/28 TRINITY_DN2462_c0_g1_i1:4-1992(-)